VKLRRRGRPVDRAASKLIPELPSVIGLLGRLLVDSRVPRGSRLLVLAVAAYAVSPLDLIPDVLGLLGLTDDIVLVALALRRLVRSAGEDVVASNWRGSPEGLKALLRSVDDLGGVLPGPVRSALRALKDPR
jgi:uncharacterized membrane protein YkvA (DUF1232 family)